MIEKLTIESFKSLESVSIDLGLVNVFIGPNGSGKSNLLEALGVLSAAADGKVNDQTLLQRGVRPGVPVLYKSAFHPQPGQSKRLSPHIRLKAETRHARYEVSLNNPLKDPRPAWSFKHELWQRGEEEPIVGRSPNTRPRPNAEQGLAALKAVELQPDDMALKLLQDLQGYVIYTPSTAVLRGTAPEGQPRNPIGLSGGQLAEAVRHITTKRSPGMHVKLIYEEALGLIDWARAYGSALATEMPLSPSAAASPRVVRFMDRYMRPGRNVLSGYDASEGALYVLFLAVLAAHESSPCLFAVENADHGLNPRLARELMSRVCDWFSLGTPVRQVLLTTHNPLVLDGLPLQRNDVRLFTVSRTSSGRTDVRRIVISDELRQKAKEGWTLSRLWVMGHLGGIANV